MSEREEWTGTLVLDHVHELEGRSFVGQLEPDGPTMGALVAFLRGIPNVTSRRTGGVYTVAVHATAVRGEARIAGLARLSCEPVVRRRHVPVEELVKLGLRGRVPLASCVEEAEWATISTVVAATVQITIDAPDVAKRNIAAWAGQLFTVTCRPADRFYALGDAARRLLAAEAIAWYKALSADDQRLAAAVVRDIRGDTRYAVYPPNGIDVLAEYFEIEAARARIYKRPEEE